MSKSRSRRSNSNAKRNPKSVAFWAFIAVALIAGIGMYVGTSARGEVSATTTAADDPEPPKSFAPQIDPASQAHIIRPSDRPLRVLVAGDSLSTGQYASSEDKGFKSVVLAGLGERGPVEAQRVGASGEIARQAIDDLDRIQGPIDFALVELGTNDPSKSDLAAFTTDFPLLLTAIQEAAPGAPMMCLGIWANAKQSQPFDEVIERECRSRGGAFVKITDIYDRGIPASRGPVDSATDSGALRDGFHPNNAGHRAIAERVLYFIDDSAMPVT